MTLLLAFSGGTMATKQITVTIADYVFDKYILTYNGDNRSKFVEEMFVRGIEASRAELEDYSVKYINAIKELREKDDEIKKLKAELGRIQARVSPQKTLEFEENTPFTEQELKDFKEKLDKDKPLRKWFSKCVDITIRNPEFKEGRYHLYKNEIDAYIKPSGFFLLLNMSIELRKRGEL